MTIQYYNIICGSFAIKEYGSTMTITIYYTLTEHQVRMVNV